MNFNNNDPMIMQAMGLCDYVSSVSEEIWQSCLATITKEMPGIDAHNIYITGCGDSYCAAVAMKPAFDALIGGIHVFPARAMDVSRRMAGFRYRDSLVISISASGKAARVVEGSRVAQQSGAATLAITSGRETPLGKNSEIVLVVPKPNVPPSPGVLSYVCSCLALAFTAIVMGAVRGNYSMDQAEEYKKKVLEYASSYRSVIPKVAQDMKTIAAAIEPMEGYDFIADGGDFATAYFGSCKYVEAFGAFCTFDDSENWEHVNYFIVDTEHMATTAVITEESPSYSRLMEAIPVCKRIHRKLFVVTDLPAEQFPQEVSVCSLPKAPLSWMSPLMMHLPFDFIAAYVAQLKQEPNFRGFQGAWSTPNKIGDSAMKF